MPGRFRKALTAVVAVASLSHQQPEIPQQQREVAPEVHRAPGSQPQRPKPVEAPAVSRPSREKRPGTREDDEPREPQRLNREQRRRRSR